MKKYLSLFFVLFTFAWAESPKDVELQKKIEDYLNGISAIASEFFQLNPDGRWVQGKVWLKRSSKQQGKMRLDYQMDLKQRIVAKDGQLFVYDLNDDSESTYSLDSTPAAFILQRNIRFQKDLAVLEVTKTIDGQYAEIKLARPGEMEGMSLTLIFSLYPTGSVKSLESWIVLDGQGNQTVVQLLGETMHVNDESLVSEAKFLPPYQNEILTLRKIPSSAH